jgi:hypothetical protein
VTVDERSIALGSINAGTSTPVSVSADFVREGTQLPSGNEVSHPILPCAVCILTQEHETLVMSSMQLLYVLIVLQCQCLSCMLTGEHGAGHCGCHVP